MHRTLAPALLLCLLCTLAVPVGAQAPRDASTPVLTPAGVLAFAELRSLVVRAELICSGAQCAVEVEQTYYVHNADRVEGVTLRLGLTGPQQGSSALDPASSQLTLVDQKGATLTAGEGDGVYALLWDVTLGRDEHRALTLRFRQTVGAAQLLSWRLGLDALAPWGEIGGLRVTLALPRAMDESAFLAVQPGNYAFDRLQLVWDSELWTASQPLVVQMVAPAAWQQLQAMRSGDDSAALARYLTGLGEAGRSMGIAMPDAADEILAAWMAAVAAQPEDQAARLALAGLYEARAAERAEQYQNYMLLAGEQLEALLQLRPADKALADKVRTLFYDAATAASRAGDPATALVYLDRAARVPGAEEQTVAQLHDLSLRWALDLAEQGRVEQALLQLAGRLAPETEDAILRYAPPFVSARTEIEQTPAGRTVRHAIELYAPSADRTVERLEALAFGLTLQSHYPFAPVVERHGQTALFELSVKADSVEELWRVSAAVEAVFTPAEDLVAALLAQPWMGSLDQYGIEQELVRSRAVYVEQVDSTGLQAAWDSQAEYVRWRLAELEQAEASGEQAQLERRLALIALRDQRFIWDQLPASTYSVLRVVHWGSDVGPSWLIPWGQTRVLSDEATTYHWNTIAFIGGTLLAALVLLMRLLAGRIARRRLP